MVSSVVGLSLVIADFFVINANSPGRSGVASAPMVFTETASKF